MAHKPNPVIQRFVLEQEKRSSSVRYLTFGRLAEDAVGHCVPKEAAQVQHADWEVVVGGLDFGGEVLVGDGASQRDGFWDFEFPYCLEGEAVYALEEW